MAIQYVGGKYQGRTGSTSTGITLDLTSLTGGIASSLQEGDIVIALHSIGTSNPTSLDRDIVTSGYTSIAKLFSSDTYRTDFYASYKIMGATPDTSVSFPASGSTTNALATAVMCFRGVDVSVFDTTTTTATGINTAKPTPPAVTPVSSGVVAVCLGANAGNGVGILSDSAADFVTFINAYGDDDIDTGVGMGYKSISSTFTPSQWGGDAYDTSSRAACTIALKPTVTSTFTPKIIML